MKLEYLKAKHRVKLGGLLLSLILVSGCATIRDFIFPDDNFKDANIHWQKTLQFEVNGKAYRGLAMVERAKEYKLRIFPNDKTIDRLQWRTCQGGDFVDKAVDRSFWRWKKTEKHFDMTFALTEIEKERACTFKIDSLAGKNKVMEFGMIIFPSSRPEVSLPALLECNRATVQTVGKGGCHAPVGTIQRITFKQKVYQDETPHVECPPLTEIKGNKFEYHIVKDECVYVFMSPDRHENGEFREYTLHTIGYEKSPPPEY